MSDTQRTFAFVDLAGFTALTEAMGDEEAVGLLGRFVELTQSALGDGDELVKSIGDAVMLASPGPEAGLSLLHRLFTGCHDQHDFPVVRAGLHHGAAIRGDGDWFGASVNLAARVAGQAHGGQLLVTSAVAEAARRRGFRTVELGEFELRNIAEPVELWEVHLGIADEAAGVDPVCRMRVMRDRAAGRLRHEDTDYWFCSLDCAGQFAADPGRYAGRPEG